MFALRPAGPLRRARPMAASRASLVLAGAAAAGLATAGLTAVGPAEPAAADGPSTSGLALQVTVNTRPGTEAVRRGIRVGHPAVKTYRLTNKGGTDLYDVRVTDPSAPGARISCGGRDRVAMLRGLSSALCTATVRARPGAWTGHAVATGRVPSLRAAVRATAPTGYSGVGGALALSESARPAGPDAAALRYTVTNHGNRPVHAIALTDRLAASRPFAIDCGGRRPVVPYLAAGRSAHCTAVVHRPPGRYVSEGLARGSDRLTTLGSSGGAAPPPALTARASAPFMVPKSPPPSRPSAPPPRRPSPAPTTAAPPAEPPPAEPPPAAPPPPGPLVPLPPEVLGIAPPPPGIVAPEAPDGAEPGAADPGAAEPPREQPQRRATLLDRLIQGDDDGSARIAALAVLLLLILPGAMAATRLMTRRK